MIESQWCLANVDQGGTSDIVHQCTQNNKAQDGTVERFGARSTILFLDFRHERVIISIIITHHGHVVGHFVQLVGLYEVFRHH